MLVQLFLTAWVLILIPFYWRAYGPQNFLWFSDIGLFGTLIALWLQSRLLMSTFALITLPMELIWSIDFFSTFFIGSSMLNIVSYMFDSRYSYFLRGLSLFHIFMPILWISYVSDWGYDERALYYAIFLCWITFLLTFWYTDPKANINWVFSPKIYNWKWISQKSWFVLLMVGLPVLVYWPLHRIFCLFFITNE